MKDNIFKQKVQKQFEFDEKVVSVFDDMISRSVPFYKENFLRPFCIIRLFFMWHWYLFIII